MTIVISQPKIAPQVNSPTQDFVIQERHIGRSDGIVTVDICPLDVID
jgi:hypothetical protein